MGTLNFFSIVLPILVRVAFVTLLERKILGLSQLRKGPNKVRTFGILQPIADAVKLFMKEVVLINKRNKFLFYFSPAAAIGLILCVTANLPADHKKGLRFVGVLLFFLLRLGVYPLFIQGWSSNSKYSLLGRLRGVAQTISYEISLALFLFIFFLLSDKFSLHTVSRLRLFNIFIGAPVALLLFIRMVAETNRTPFDFAEGESELVSGFNTEFGGGLFALIFMAEYGIIIFFRYLLSILIFGNIATNLRTVVGGQGFVFSWIWLRRTYPRYRYDKLLNIAWKSFLPWAICLLSFYLSLTFI